MAIIDDGMETADHMEERPQSPFAPIMTIRRIRLLSSITGQGHIMVVDDDNEIRDILRILLSSENFKVTEAATPSAALSLMSPDIDLVILDVTMPERSGYDLCQQIRKISNVPILFLTAKSGNSDLMMGYAAGGDDYLSKPFAYPELIVRVKGLLRRYIIYQGRHTSKPREDYITYGDLCIDCVHNYIWKNSQPIEFTDTEYRILKLLISHPGQLFPAQHIYEAVWGEDFLLNSTNTVMVFIRKIREKIEDDPKHPSILVTVWGRGYKIV